MGARASSPREATLPRGQSGSQWRAWSGVSPDKHLVAELRVENSAISERALYKTSVSSDLHFPRLENDFFKTKRALKRREGCVAGDFAINQGKKES